MLQFARLRACAAPAHRVLALRTRICNTTAAWRPLTRPVAAASRAFPRHYSSDHDQRRRDAIEVSRKAEVESLFDCVCTQKDDGTKYMDRSGLRRLLLSLGHKDGTKALDDIVKDAETKYGPHMLLPDLMKECDKYIHLSTERYFNCVEELHEAFNVYDRDASGSISPEELMTMLSTTGGHMTLEQARKIIYLFDKNGDGAIDFGEFCSLLEEGVISWRFRTGYRVVFVCGGPGSGKGTLAERLAKKVGVGHVSTGELLREQSMLGTELGLEVREIMKRGGLVGAPIVMRMLREHLQSQPGKRVLIDGFPRSVANLVDFEAVCGTAEFVLWFDAPDEVLINRLLKRGKQSGRADDQDLETIKRRIAVYRSVVDPLEKYFTENGYKIYRIDSSKSIKEVEAQLLAIPEFALDLKRREKLLQGHEAGK